MGSGGAGSSGCFSHGIFPLLLWCFLTFQAGKAGSNFPWSSSNPISRGPAFPPVPPTGILRGGKNSGAVNSQIPTSQAGMGFVSLWIHPENLGRQRGLLGVVP